MRIKYKSVLVLIILLFAFSTTVLADELETITGVTVQGNEHIPAKEILSVVKVKAGEVFDPEVFKKDLEAISKLGYFEEVRGFVKPHEGGLMAVFEVTENPLIEGYEITGNTVFKDPEIISWLGLMEGQVFNINDARDGMNNVRNKYRENGYFINYKDVRFNDGIFYLTLNEARLNDIIIKGNEKTKDYVIRRELEIEEGDIVNVEKIREGYFNLLKLNFFQEVKPNLKPTDDPGKLDLVIEVKETKTGNANFGVSHSTRDGWFGYVNVRERNLLGKGQTLGFELEYGGEVQNYSIYYYEPWLLGTPTSFGISIYDKTSDDVTSEDKKYVEHRRGGNLSFGHDLNEDWYGQVKLKIEDSEIDWDDTNIPDESGSTRSLTLMTRKDTRNHPLYPTSGGVNTVSVEYAGQALGGDYNFTKYNLDVRRYFQGFKDKHAWAVKMETGIGEGDIPVVEQYRLGGSNTLRGYDRGDFTGKNMLLFNVEYSFPIVERKLDGVVFADAGNTWDKLENVDLTDLNYSTGLGVRLNTPLGKIRLDYGFDEDWNGKFHFSLGPTF
ncbi:BamA/OMP85 family outer membrane protein [Halothermothrix orenii]|uniref:Surface antigen (D15) n=1 Tax=Halothermothrix orenii (strain H 168 / OCM 544 / DSM 9562) TaxID=373903 RepID=B8CYZ8_HALOH|nr:BamA/TamA family outer membrane protein [Halothermothrix orenii]ACL70517.1 surface antigen (D15) [Halothermothrix orenii H 168]